MSECAFQIWMLGNFEVFVDVGCCRLGFFRKPNFAFHRQLRGCANHAETPPSCMVSLGCASARGLQEAALAESEGGMGATHVWQG